MQISRLIECATILTASQTLEAVEIYLDPIGSLVFFFARFGFGILFQFSLYQSHSTDKRFVLWN